MRKMLLAVLLLTITLSVTAVSNGKSVAVAQTVKLSPKVQETYIGWLAANRLTLNTETISKERNLFRIDVEGTRVSELGVDNITGYVLIRTSGDLEMSELVVVL